jgi:hypothetical protein
MNAPPTCASCGDPAPAGEVRCKPCSDLRREIADRLEERARAALASRDRRAAATMIGALRLLMTPSEENRL